VLSPCPAPSAVWRLNMVMRETYVGHFVNVWEVSLAGAASDELTEILDPVLPCGFQTQGDTDDNGTVVTWGGPHCQDDGLAVFCEGTVPSTSSFVQTHISTAHMCGQVVDDNPSTLTAFESLQSPSITFQQMGSLNSFDRLFLYKSGPIHDSRQLKAFVIKCVDEWSLFVDLNSHTHSWSSTLNGWVTIPFNKPCRASLIKIADMQAPVANQLFYVLEMSLGKSDSDAQKLPRAGTNKIDGYCIQHQTLPKFESPRVLESPRVSNNAIQNNDGNVTRWECNGGVPRNLLIGEFDPEFKAAIPCGSVVKVQARVPKTTVSMSSHGDCNCSEAMASNPPIPLNWKNSPLSVAVFYKGSEVMARSKILDAGSNKTVVDADSGFSLLGTTTFLKKAQLVLTSGNVGCNFAYSLEGAIMLSYWIKYPEAMECPMPAEMPDNITMLHS